MPDSSSFNLPSLPSILVNGQLDGCAGDDRIELVTKAATDMTTSTYLGPLSRNLLLVLALVGLTFAGSVGVALPRRLRVPATTTQIPTRQAAIPVPASFTPTTPETKFDMFYSGTCQTNWVQWTGPNVYSWKRVQSGYGHWTRWKRNQAQHGGYTI